MKVNKDSHVFTILFTFVSTVVLVFPLTLAYVGTKPIADDYWRLQHYVKTLHSLGLPADVKHPAEAKAAYEKLQKFTVGKVVKDTAGKVAAAKNQALAYVCRGPVCSPPLSDPQALRQALTRR